MQKFLLLAATLVFGPAGILFAQTNPVVAAAAPAAAPAVAAVVAPKENPAPAASAPAAPAKPDPNARNIRFQFEGMPYSDVIERFAQMANKPLLSNTNVQGTLTYSDPNPYTYGEALDTLNTILSMKGVMLVESGNNLQLVPFKELPQMPHRIMRGLNQTGDVRPREVVTVVLDVKNLDAKEVADSITPMLSNAGSLAPLSKGRGLIITDRLENIQRIRTLLATIDTETAVNRQMKTFTLLHASGAIVSDLLNRTFGIATAPKRTQYNPNNKALEVLPPDPNDYITSVYDEASRTLVLFGPRERLDLAEELIAKFEQKEGGPGDVRIYFPQTIRAEELANIIRQAIPGVAGPNETSAAAATKARVISDQRDNRLIVAAPIPGQMDAIEQLINRVDKPVHGSSMSLTNVPMRSQTIQMTRVFRPRTTEVTNVATILSQALTRKGPSGRVETTASVSVDVPSQSVVVSGSPGDVQVASDIITQLETGSTQPAPLQTRFIELSSIAEARRLQPLVEQLYKNQVSGTGGTVAHAKILVDSQAPRLIVTASEDHLQRIETLVKQLRVEQPAPDRHLRIIPLVNTRVDLVFKTISDLVTERMSDRKLADLPKPSLTADSPNNRLLVTATPDEFKDIEEIVKTVDVAPERAAREVRLLPVNAKAPAEIIQLVNQVLEQGPQNPVMQQSAPKLMPDVSGKQIILLAQPSDMERVQKLVQQFDQFAGGGAARQMKAVQLYARNAGELTPLVQQLYTEQIKGQLEPAGGPANLLTEPKNNRIMVSGSDKEIARVEAIVRQLDPEGRPASREETRVVRLKSATAAELSGLLEKSLNTQQQQVRVLVDARSNSLVVSGDAGAVQAATDIIQQLDASPRAQPREMRILNLKSADANAISPMVNNLFAEMIKDQHGAGYVTQTRIVPDPASNRLIVTGLEDEIGQIAELVQKLDQTPEQAPGARVFKLNGGDAVMLAPIVSNAMVRFDQRGMPIKRVTVTPDEKSNSLIVAGTRSDLQDAASVIEKLDEEGTTRQRILKIMDVRTTDPDALATLATKVFAAQNPGRNLPSLVSITADAAGKRLMVLAPVNMISQVEAVINSLDEKPDQAARELHTIELKTASANELLPKVTQIYNEQAQGKSVKPATIYPDASGARFTIFGTKEQAAQVQQIVETLQAAQVPVRETKVFDLGKAAEAQRILPLAQKLYRDQIGNNPQLGATDAQFMTDGRTGRVIVSARTNQLQAIGEIFANLQVTPGTNQPVRETRAIDVGSAADVQRMLPLVQQLYQDQWKDKSEADPADAQILADTKAGRFIVTGKPEHLDKIQALVQQVGGGKARTENRETRVYDLSTANAMELSTTVRTLYQEQAKSRLGSQPADSLIVPDASANRLIVVADVSELEAIEDIIKKLDKVSAQSASTRVFKLKSAEPEKVAEILSTALVRFDAYGRQQKRVSVVVDSKTRTLIATGDPKELQGVAVIIEQLDSSLGAQPTRQMRVVQVKKGRVGELTSKVRQLYNDQVKSQPELGVADALIMEDSSSNQFILAGSDPQIQLIEKIVTELQSAQPSPGDRETRIIDIPQADDTRRLVSTVQQLYQEHWKNKDVADPADAQIISDSTNGRLIVTGRTNHLAEIAAIIQQLSTTVTNSEIRETRVYDLDTTVSTELASTVRSLYQEELRSRSVPLASQARILPDSAANRLIVSGNTNELARVEEIVHKLDSVNAKAGNTRVFKLEHALADQVATVLSSALVQINRSGTRVPRVSVGADTANNLLIVSGESKDLQSAETIVQKIDAMGAPERRQMRIIPLTSGSPTSVSRKVQALYEDQVKGTNGAPNALIMGDDASSRLIITASESHLAIIEAIIKQLEESGKGGGRQLRVIPVENNSASAIASLITQLFAKQIASRDDGERLVISALADDRTIGLDAAGETLDRVEKLIKTLDTKPGEGKDVINTVHLKKGRAEDLAQAINQSVTSRNMKAVAQRVRVTPVAGPNSLLISGPGDLVEQVMKLIKELDDESTGGEIEVRIFKLENGHAKELSNTLQQLLQTVSRQGRLDSGRFVPASVSVDDRSNSLIISGNEAHFKVVEKILPTLDKAPERSDRDVQFVWLRKAKAFDVVSKIESVFANRPRDDRPIVESDSVGNSLTLIAKRGDMKQIQDLIGRLDESAKDSSLQVRLRAIDSVSAEQMARMLQNIYPQMSASRIKVVDKVQPPAAGTNAPPAGPALPPVPAAQPAPAGQAAAAPEPPGSPEVVISVDKESNALILSGPVQELDSIERLISDLSFSFSGNEAEFRVFSLKHADPIVVARMLSDLMRPEPIQLQPGQNPQTVRLQQQRPRITVVPEPRTRGIVVRARPTDFALLESIIKQLDSAGEIAQVDFRIVPLTNASPYRMLPLVQQMITQLNAARPGEQASVMPDPRSRGILVVAHQSALDQIEKMIHALDTPARTAEADVVILPLKHANAGQVSQLLQGMIRTGAAGELTAENRELQDQVRRLKVQNEKGEAISLDLSKPIKINAETGAENGNRIVITSTPENLSALAAVVNLLDTTALSEGVDVKIVPLEHADASSVAQTLNTIFSQGQKLTAGPGVKTQPQGDTGKALTNPLNVSVDQRSNILILSGRQESLDLAMRVIKDLDQKVEKFLTEVKLYRLKHATATRLVPLLQSVFAEGPAVPGTEGLSRQVTRLRTLREGARTPNTTDDPKSRMALVIQADDISNTLVISARTDMLPLIEDVIEQMDIPAASGLETVRIYPLNHADPTSLLKILTDLYTGPRAASLRNEDKPIVSIDQRTSSLIVAGNGKAFAMLEALLQQLDQKLPFDLRDIHIVPLQNSDAVTLAPVLQRMMDARVTQKAALNRGDADTLKVFIFPDERSNALLIGGSKDSFELVESLVKQLDTSSPALSGQIRLVPLTNADSRVIASTLTTLFTQRYAAARTADTQRHRPVILADPRSNSLLVSATVEDNHTLDDLLAKLDRKMENPSLLLTVLPLKHNDASRVATLLETLFTARQRAQTLPGQTPLPSEEIKVEPDAINNALIVSASKENLEHIQDLLEKIDVEPDVVGGLLQIFTLQYADAQRVATMLRSLVSQGLYKPGAAGITGRRGGGGGAGGIGGRDALAVSVDPRSNTLIISASPENLAITKEIIQHVDTKDYSDATNVRSYALKHARASTLAATLTQFFQAKRTSEAVGINAAERTPPVSVIPDDRTNTLLVTGGKEAFDVVERLLQELDNDGVFARMNFRVFPLTNATAIKLQPVLQQIFSNRPARTRGEPIDPITVVADAWVNALLVGASVEDMTSVEALIQKLDGEQSGPGIAIQVFPLAKADARKVAQTVQSLYREGTPGGSAFPISVSSDDRINAIVVSAGENDAKRIGELVKKLDTDQVARVSEIKVFPLKFARAEALATVLNTALNTKPAALSDVNPNAQSVLQFITRSEEGKQLVTAALKESVLITPDGRMNSLIVSGPVDYMGLIEQIVTHLDASSPQQAKIKVFTLQNADARQMSDLLRNMFHMTQVPGAAPSRSIQYTLVRSLTDQTGNELGEQEVASATLGTAEENALTVTVDLRTNSLLVGGTEHYVKLVSEIIESLDSSPASERKTEVVRLKNSQAADVATAIRTFQDQERQRVSSVLGVQAIGTSQRVLEHEVAVVAETNSNTLLVSADPRYFMQIKDMIDELDRPQAQVMIQVLLAEVTLDATTDLGFEWTYSGKQGNVLYGLGADVSTRKAAGNLFSGGGYASSVASDFSFLLRALKDDGRLEVLSRPQIVTADNKPASINIGQRVPLITDSRLTAQSDTINSFRYEDIGVNLTVTPKISPDGFVKMEISSTNSTISSATVEINKNATVPIINQRRASTTVSCQSGQTILIGGLIATTDDQRVRKVPWLGDIPYVGVIFRTKHNMRDRKELLILLTPQVLANNEAASPLIKTYEDITRESLDKSGIKNEIKRDKLQKQILDPLFPDKVFEDKPMPKPRT